ncbi:hypothetical protein ARMGADRAFT_926685 [Armillaria gallica]|uniref:FAR1 domain-containing protein n=1 Tax=Armillaria gallica TaxID=47427 RepID=A0A2H3E5P7_ARMGA|nr:hypothetical protein ARMGADRAFT_926685 [Armillaria gallica]
MHAAHQSPSNSSPTTLSCVSKEPGTETATLRKSLCCHGTVHNFDFDKSHGYSLEWASEIEFQAWLKSEIKAKCIEFNLKETRCNKKAIEDQVWTDTWMYVCAREGGGGAKKNRQKSAKAADWDRKVPIKRLADGCPCWLQVKRYPDTNLLCGKYNDTHSHDIGKENILYTNIS